MLSATERSTLLSLARTSIEGALERRAPDFGSFALTPGLLQHAGAFVTLQKCHELRGCIGTIEAIEPLYQSVARNAVNAAFRDPRFPSLTGAELDEISIEISVMGPPQRVRDSEDIEVGRDGLIVRRGGMAGLLLPQVAIEWGWDRETFLTQTCLKAGLAPSAWRDPATTIEKFAAEIFS